MVPRDFEGFETEAQLETMRGAQAQKGALIGAAGSVLLGGAKAAGSFGGTQSGFGTPGASASGAGTPF